MTAAVAVGLFFADDPRKRGFGICLGFVLLTVMVHRAERARWGVRGHVSPVSLYTLFWTFYFAIIGLASLSGAEADQRLNFESFAPVRSLLVAFGSLVLVAIGYFAVTRRPRALRSGTASVNQRLKTDAVLFVLGVGWACRLLLFAESNFGYLRYGDTRSGIYLSALALGDRLLQVGLTLLAYGAWSRSEDDFVRRRCGLLLVANLPALVYVGIASGFKGQLLTDLSPVTIMYFMCRGKIPWRAVGALTLYLAVILSGVERYRADVQQGIIADEKQTGVVSTASQIIPRIVSGALRTPPHEMVSTLYGHVVNEYSGINTALAAILEKTPEEVPFLGVRRLFVYPIVFLPVSSLLDDEPVEIGSYVNSKYLGGTELSSFPPTQPGDLYLSGGWGAVVAGELVVGFLLGWVWLAIGSRPSQRRWVLYGLLATFFSNAGTDVGTLLRTGLQATLVYAVVLRLTFAQESSGQDGTAPTPAVPAR